MRLNLRGRIGLLRSRCSCDDLGKCHVTLDPRVCDYFVDSLSSYFDRWPCSRMQFLFALVLQCTPSFTTVRKVGPHRTAPQIQVTSIFWEEMEILNAPVEFKEASKKAHLFSLSKSNPNQNYIIK